MKLTIKKDKYNLELSKFERDCLFLVAGSSSGTGMVSSFLSKTYDELSDHVKESEGKDIYGYYCHLSDRSQLRAKIELYDTLKEESFDFVKKQNCSFLYPKENYRREKTYDIRFLEQRKLNDSYEQNGYLMGLDKGKMKKFKMDLVVNLKYSE